MNFHQQVFALVSAIPAGKVLNYGTAAELLGKPQAARAVGYALNALPPGSDVPWYRVVGKNGIYGKCTIRGSQNAIDHQMALLKDEGIQFDQQDQFVLLDYLWQPDPDEVAQILADQV